jgi:hypothetical protein
MTTTSLAPIAPKGTQEVPKSSNLASHLSSSQPPPPLTKSTLPPTGALTGDLSPLSWVLSQFQVIYDNQCPGSHNWRSTARWSACDDSVRSCYAGGSSNFSCPTTNGGLMRRVQCSMTRGRP